MKSPFFKSVEIDKTLISSLVARHPELIPFINPELPFYVRISKKPYPGLIHTIISDEETNENVIAQWQKLLSVCKKIKPQYVVDLSVEQLENIVGVKKAKLINQISNDLDDGTLNLKRLIKKPQDEIMTKLCQYDGLSLDVINKFMLFSCFKQNVLCEQDPDFIKGLKIFLEKEMIEQDDINNIKIKYKGELTLFSLCMWRIRNERRK